MTPIITLSKVQAAFCRRAEGQTVSSSSFLFFFFFCIFLITHVAKEDIQHYLLLGYKVYQLKQQTEKKQLFNEFKLHLHVYNLTLDKHDIIMLK